MKSKHFSPAYPFSSHTLDSLFHQVAISQIVLANTQTHWRETDLNAGGKAIYNLKWILTAGHAERPGFTEVSLPKGLNVRAEADKRTTAIWSAFLAAFHRGPGAAHAFTQNQHTQLRRSVTDIQRTYLEAKQVNQQVDQLLQTALFWAYTVKFTAEIGMNVLGLIPGGAMVGFLVRTGIGVGYPVAVELINDPTAAKVAIVAFYGAMKTNLSSILSDSATMGHAELKMVTQPLARARWQSTVANLRNARLGTAETAAAAKTANQALLVRGVQSTVRGVGFKTAAIGMTGVSCYYAYTGSVQSGEDYQKALQSL